MTMSSARSHKTKRPSVTRLPRRVQTVLADFQRRVLGVFPSEISQLILFGSYARGEAARTSDIDVLVVVRWSEEKLPDGSYVAPIHDPRWQSIINAAADSMLAVGLEVAPLVVSERRFQEGFPLIARVKREGVVLWTTTLN